MQSSQDQFFLKQTLKLAKKGMGWVSPNPMVGALLVKDNKVIGQGFHKRIGLPHAEIGALSKCKTSPAGSTLYVNLEPCSHFGRTPPCVDSIISSGVKKVACCSLDPNPKVSGAGIAILKKAGIKVLVTGLKEAGVLNEAFFTFHQKKRPFIAVKFSSSLDGKIATCAGDSKWITNEKARDYARKLRGQYQAVLVGVNTVLRDDPHLGVRMAGKKDPPRIILDSRLRILVGSQVLRDKNVLIVTTNQADREKTVFLRKRGFEMMVFGDEKIQVPKLLALLKQKEIISCLVEGGGQVLGSFIDAGMVDKVYAFHAPVLIGGEKAVSAVGGGGANKIADALRLRDVFFKKFDDNMLTIGYPE